MTAAKTGEGARDPLVDPLESLDRLLRDLRSSRTGLSTREAQRRMGIFGGNELVRRPSEGWFRALGRQLVHPLALLLWVAAALAAVSSSIPLSIAIVVVIALNAAFAFVQERHADRAVEALAAYLPQRARVLRDDTEAEIDARELVPGDVIMVSEGDRVSADARLLDGLAEIDASTLTGESTPVRVSADSADSQVPLVHARDVVFSGTSCVTGDATAVVFATGMHTELGRIAALSQRGGHQESPLEKQVKRVARLIAFVALGMGVAFIPLGTLAGLSLSDSVTFAIGLIVANVPEGLLPTITLALAVGVRLLARRGALVKRISAVETLGSTSVICTDKTGTLTVNRMTVAGMWTSDGVTDLDVPRTPPTPSPVSERLLRAAVWCSNAELAASAGAAGSEEDEGSTGIGDPTELALLRAAARLGIDPHRSKDDRLAQFGFDPTLRRMSTVDRVGTTTVVHTKGAPEELLARCTHIAEASVARPLTDADRATIERVVDDWARRGRRLLALAERALPPDEMSENLVREQAEQGSTLLGVAAMIDPPRPEVADAVDRCHTAGIRLIVVTGDHALTARGIAESVHIGRGGLRVIGGPEADAMSDRELDAALAGSDEIVFARSSPETKLRITDALQKSGHIVAMTGDGANDAPALRQADIGVAMGRSGTDVAREAAVMVLVDDDFATIVGAIEAGRRVYDNVRKFIVYIFAHATPEVVPFLAYALTSGGIPLPLTIMQILAVDLGTETLPALALGRENPEPDLMDRPPRPRTQSVITGPMLARSWGLLGGVSALLVMGLFLLTLLDGGWTFGADTGTGALHHTWEQATTMTFLGIVACQIGTAMAARTSRSSLAQIGFTTNRMLIWGIVFEIVFAAAVVTIPPLQSVFGTAVPPAWLLALLLPLPVIVWGCDEAFRWWTRTRRTDSAHRGDGEF